MNLRAWLVLLAPWVGLAALLFGFDAGAWTPIRIAGLCVAVTGFGLVTLARLQLGSAFSLAPRATRLVTTGLYARIRHPIYVFSLLGLVGLVIFFEAWVLLLALLVIVPVQLGRAREEERVLESAFGDEYRRHRKGTWF